MSQAKNQATETSRERDYETYRMLLELWRSENPIKTNKLQILLLTNALLVSAVAIAGGFRSELWYLYAAGAVFSAIWLFSIGRTSLFQDVWQVRLQELQARYPDDPRFSILATDKAKRQARRLTRTFGAVPSRWYLLYAPLAFALAWLAILALTR